MYQILLLIHVFIAIFIVGMVLVQQGKGASMGAAFGSGASQTVFGSRGSGSFLFRLTITFAMIFFATSLLLNYLTMYSYKQAQAQATLPLQNLQTRTAPVTQIPTTVPATIPSTPVANPVVKAPAAATPNNAAVTHIPVEVLKEASAAIPQTESTLPAVNKKKAKSSPTNNEVPVRE